MPAPTSSNFISLSALHEILKKGTPSDEGSGQWREIRTLKPDIQSPPEATHIPCTTSKPDHPPPSFADIISKLNKFQNESVSDVNGMPPDVPREVPFTRPSPALTPPAQHAYHGIPPPPHTSYFTPSQSPVSPYPHTQHNRSPAPTHTRSPSINQNRTPEPTRFGSGFGRSPTPTYSVKNSPTPPPSYSPPPSYTPPSSYTPPPSHGSGVGVPPLFSVHTPGPNTHAMGSLLTTGMGANRNSQRAFSPPRDNQYSHFDRGTNYSHVLVNPDGRDAAQVPSSRFIIGDANANPRVNQLFNFLNRTYR